VSSHAGDSYENSAMQSLDRAFNKRFVMQKTASLNFCTPDSFYSCKKPLRSIFALRTVFIHAKNRFAQFLHSGQFFIHAKNRFAQFLHSGQFFWAQTKSFEFAEEEK